ncbi:MAG: polysaccharide deacetylase family protein [Flavobacteriales bacterium]|nr:polysaccharide deacetylase family protein [Flavobacteriales bacterium]MCW8913669.1 polysaccharide deacetylase family protein [Flavobacteriales bacterium]MCW8937841.1 polysaccharide deacetylase family protein [Flavobacteriales bacterium]MCW8940456.1 polysaccharide deacetylase family protein [Flavobacteriales bacterium]MCW8968341.1 polysaccharide deacetylase family protein [Flavobacteriales bacterium]
MYLVKSPFFLKKYYANFIWKIPTTEKIIYLTFDDGPTPEITEWTLTTLKKFNAKATFFCIGNNVSKHPIIFNKIMREGHAVGNHTHHHLNGWHTNNETYLSNIKKCEEVVKSKLFRPPYGRIKKSQYELIKNDYQVIMWDVLSGDFDPKTSPEKCLRNVINNATEGAIIVFHDSLKATENLKYTLPIVLSHFTEQGYRFEKL